MKPSVLTLAIFGSQVRGDADPLSDLDVLIITDSGKPDTADIEKYFKDEYKQNSDISIYSFSRLKEMYGHGHLFAWHLFQESKFIPYKNTKNLIGELGKPNLYNDAHQDISELIGLLNSIETELKFGVNSVYEAGLLYVCLRNIALSASWYSESGLKFGRYSPFQLGNKMPTLRIKVDEYELLAMCRYATTRGALTPKVDNTFVLNHLKFGRDWAIEIQNLIGKT